MMNKLLLLTTKLRVVILIDLRRLKTSIVVQAEVLVII